jgi:hypothetical protein
LVSTDGFAGEYVYYPHQTIVLAHASAPTLGRLGFRYGNGFGVPQNNVGAADPYRRAAEQSDTWLGLSCDKGHGVQLDYMLAYKWLDFAAARGSGRDRTFLLRLRDTVASMMSLAQSTKAGGGLRCAPPNTFGGCLHCSLLSEPASHR